ncbi:MAG: hypothetical protein AVDCRST_MAG73-90 [uncultured Thermomicrobiales bacterium]|uniref:Uncharacterized protein n=1 Tax=uncultured Thermomicrobiales bacterium TaxID=1645740 RepID=A0A6J4TC37_9BACT|nr:MAG: hypothetical protein AVDCRST_MAG73-90 [uncultured Thermomicrobiales bacterium]
MSATVDPLAPPNDRVAQTLLRSTIPARLAHTGRDGAPRVFPIRLHWDGEVLVFGSPPTAPKVAVLSDHSQVAVTIDGNEFPYRVLTIRGAARVELVDGVVPEYSAAARRYFGEDGGRAWVDQIGGLFSQVARIAVRPEHVTILNFEARFPNAVADAMADAGSGSGAGS